MKRTPGSCSLLLLCGIVLGCGGPKDSSRHDGSSGGPSVTAGNGGSIDEGEGSGGSFREGPIVTVPDLGPRTIIVDPSTDLAALQSRLDTIAEAQDSRDNEFGPERYAILFHPGSYDLNVFVGYYTQVAGLGISPSAVTIRGGVESRQVRETALSNFWRAVENVSIVPVDGTNTWAASQAAPLRRVHIQGNLALSEGGYTSGGFLADSKIDGTVSSGTQQQYFSRNDSWNVWSGGVWNMMFVGVTSPPPGEWPASPHTVIEKTPKVREKPFLYVQDDGSYHVFVPSLREGAVGVSWEEGSGPGTSLPINDFYVAHESTDSAATINAALSAGKHLLLTPGRYSLDESLKIERPGTVVLGLGFPSLIPTTGQAAMEIADVDDVTLAGVTFDAGLTNSPTLLRVGVEGEAADHELAPTVLSDVFCRVGTSQPGAAGRCVTIHKNDVIADHFWLWRADHGPSATAGRPGWNVNVSANGLVVDGDDVTIYGLFNEHFQEYQTLWNGEGGRVYFYQCEMPYDPPNQASWSHDGVDGYAAYKVAEGVKDHQAWGLGIYSTFQVAPVFAENAIEVPDSPQVRMQHMTTFFLSAQGGIRNVINGLGDDAVDGSPQGIVDQYGF